MRVEPGEISREESDKILIEYASSLTPAKRQKRHVITDAEATADAADAALFI